MSSSPFNKMGKGNYVKKYIVKGDPSWKGSHFCSDANNDDKKTWFSSYFLSYYLENVWYDEAV